MTTELQLKSYSGQETGLAEKLISDNRLLTALYPGLKRRPLTRQSSLINTRPRWHCMKHVIHERLYDIFLFSLQNLICFSAAMQMRMVLRMIMGRALTLIRRTLPVDLVRICSCLFCRESVQIEWVGFDNNEPLSYLFNIYFNMMLQFHSPGKVF
jgi:hypothetical protein